MTEKIKVKIDAVGKEARAYEDYFTRGVKVGDKWYNVTDGTPELVNKLFTEELLSRNNEVELEVAGNIIKSVKLIAKGQKFQKTGFRKTPVSFEEAAKIMEQCVNKSYEIAKKINTTTKEQLPEIEERLNHEDIRTIANTMFMRIMDK